MEAELEKNENLDKWRGRRKKGEDTV